MEIVSQTFEEEQYMFGLDEKKIAQVLFDVAEMKERQKLLEAKIDEVIKILREGKAA